MSRLLVPVVPVAMSPGQLMCNKALGWVASKSSLTRAQLKDWKIGASI